MRPSQAEMEAGTSADRGEFEPRRPRHDQHLFDHSAAVERVLGVSGNPKRTS